MNVGFIQLKAAVHITDYVVPEKHLKVHPGPSSWLGC